MLELSLEVKIFRHEEPVNLIGKKVLIVDFPVLECVSEPRSCSVETRHALFFKHTPFTQHKALSFYAGEQGNQNRRHKSLEQIFSHRS